jgi:predicted membrane channel-forming protein YqfA (hemolysin III family)
MKIKLGSATSFALVRSIIAGSVSLIIYLLVVLITTPNLTPLATINAALKVNWLIIFGLALGVGLQVYVSSYGRNLGCRITNRRKSTLASSGSATISSFFSFFSLVPLGCCGSWLLILSFLPSIFGSAFSVILIQYSKPLSFLGLFTVLGYAIFTAIRLKRELKTAKIVESKRKI